MERTPTFASDNGHGVNESQRFDDVDNMIIKVTEVAPQLSQESDHPNNDVITRERRDTDERSSVRTAVGEVRAKNDNSTVVLDYYTDWYEAAFCERITMTARSGGSAQARSFVKYAAVVTEPPGILVII